ncbi:hypothetical protein, partial [Bacillus mycoides]|uniref:hypothetical protein n=1 Tax=Bacillus mycoides TaxID=1405 RepID=UPI0019D64577
SIKRTDFNPYSVDLENCEIGNTPNSCHKVSNTDQTVVRITSKNRNGIGRMWGTEIVIGPNKV